MKVLFYPEPSKINAYYKILLQYCDQSGIRSDGARGFSFKVFYAACNSDIVHINWTSRIENSYWNIVRFSLLMGGLKLFSKKIIWTVHNYYPHEDRDKKRSDLLKRILSVLATEIYTHSSTLTERLIKRLKVEKKIHTIFHPTFETIHDIPHNVLENYRLISIDRNKIAILFFGYIRKYKGLQNILSYFERDSSCKCCQLLVVGSDNFYWEDDSEKKALIDRIQHNENIYSHLSFIEDNEVHIYLNTADILIIPYDQSDTSGIAMLAITFGKTAIIKRSSFTDSFSGDSPFIVYETEDELDYLLKTLTKKVIQEKQDAIRRIQSTHSVKSFFKQINKMYKIGNIFVHAVIPR